MREFHQSWRRAPAVVPRGIGVAVRHAGPARRGTGLLFRAVDTLYLVLAAPGTASQKPEAAIKVRLLAIGVGEGGGGDTFTSAPFVLSTRETTAIISWD